MCIIGGFYGECEVMQESVGKKFDRERGREIEEGAEASWLLGIVSRAINSLIT